MRLFLTTYNKTGTHQIMPALHIDPNIEDRSNNSMTSIPNYARTETRFSFDGAFTTYLELAFFERCAFGHLSYLSDYAKAIQAKPTKVIFNVRDPRDVIVSELYNMKRKGKYAWLNFYLPEKGCHVFDDDDPISHLIVFAKRWERWLGWLEHDFVYKIKYEDLRLNGLETCEKLAEWLDPYEIDPVEVANKLPPRKTNPTFRSGNIGDWKTEFSKEHKKMATEKLGHIIEKLGYEL